MLNRHLTLPTIAFMLFAASAYAQENNTIYIQSNEIVPYHAPLSDDRNGGTPAKQLLADPAFETAAVETQMIAEPAYDAVSEPETDAVPAQRIEAETETGLWLKLQSSGKIAGTHYTLPGQTATQIFQRYLKSFSHPIPDEFARESSTRSR